MPIEIQHRRGTAAAWASANPVVYAGEPTYETDTGVEKIGDGVTPYNNLLARKNGSYLKIPSTSSLPYLHRAISNVVSGLQDRTVLFVGDSITYGYSGWCGQGPCKMVAKILSSAGIHSEVGLAVPNANGAGGTDSRWSAGAGWGIWNLLGGSGISWGGNPGGYIANAGAGANTLTYTPGTMSDTYDIYYLMGPSTGGSVTIYGTFNVNVNGGTNTPISCSVGTTGALRVGKTTITAASASASNVVQIGSTSVTNTVIIGIDARLSTQPTLRISNAGSYGTTTAAWTNTANYPGIDPVSCIAAYAPDVTVLGLGVNDANTSVSVATYQANLLTLITAAKLTGDVILWDPVPSPGSSGKWPSEAAYAAAMPAFAAANNCGYVSVWNEWGASAGGTALYALGYYLVDGIHPSTNVGYPDIARILASAVIGS